MAQEHINTYNKLQSIATERNTEIEEMKKAIEKSKFLISQTEIDRKVRYIAKCLIDDLVEKKEFVYGKSTGTGGSKLFSINNKLHYRKFKHHRKYPMHFLGDRGYRTKEFDYLFGDKFVEMIDLIDLAVSQYNDSVYKLTDKQPLNIKSTEIHHEVTNYETDLEELKTIEITKVEIKYDNDSFKIELYDKENDRITMRNILYLDDRYYALNKQIIVELKKIAEAKLAEMNKVLKRVEDLFEHYGFSHYLIAYALEDNKNEAY